MSAADILKQASETYRERNKTYGDNFLKVGKVMEVLFPDGLTIKTEADHNRHHLFVLAVVKMTRYVENWHKGGHQDSLRDLAVYAAMLESYDAGDSNLNLNLGELKIADEQKEVDEVEAFDLDAFMKPAS